MREFTKSLVSYSWSNFLFGVQQTLNILTPPGQRQAHPTTNAFNNVAGAARHELNDALGAVYRAGDNLQRGLVDATFSILTLGIFRRGDGSGGSTTAGATQAATEFTRQTAETVGRATSDLGEQTAEAFERTFSSARQARRE